MRHQHAARAFTVLAVALAIAIASAPATAQLPPPPREVLRRSQMLSPKLMVSEPLVPLAQAGATARSESAQAWQRFAAEAPGPWGASVDLRSGEIASATGAGLPPWTTTGREVSLGVLEVQARQLLARYGSLLGVEGWTLRLDEGRSGQLAPHVWAIDFDVLAGERIIEGTRVVFRLNNGRLVEMGTENLPSPGTKAPDARLSRDQARQVVDRHVGGFRAEDEFLDAGSLHLLPVNLDTDQERRFQPGRGRGLALVWQFLFRRPGVIGTFRARVDATSGELLELQDVNRYAQATGGAIFDASPTTELSRPLPFVDLGGGTFANSAGLYTFGGTPLTSTLTGQFVTIDDSCGSISLATDGSGNLVFGTAAGSNCVTPGVGGAGNTRAARTAYNAVNRDMEIARGWLPGNAFLNGNVTTRTNLSGTCNGFWDGVQLNLYQAVAGSCGASGEEPGFLLHELGHGIDSNDGNGGSEGASGESYGDINAVMALHNSCVGSGFWLANCTGYGDACSACTGLRDVDWARHAANTPHTVDNYARPICSGVGDYPGPCGTSAHCESYIPSEAIWDFINRDVPGAGSSAAWALGERLFFSSRPTATTAYTCTTSSTPWTSNGCNIGSAWRVFRLMDDDDSDPSNGTPHGGALFAAFDRHGIACASDPGASTTFSGCTPPPVPTLTATGGTNQASLSWTSSGAGIVYDLQRTQTSCDTGFTNLTNGTATTSFPDTELANGSTYYYRVVAYPLGNPACAAAPSACQTVNLSGADPSIRPWGWSLDPQETPYWQTPDIWVDNEPDGTVNEYGEPSRGLATNRLFARVTNSGNAPTGSYRVTFAAKPYTTSAAAPAATVGFFDETTPLGAGASRNTQVTWDLSDTWVHANFDSMFWTATHFCVIATIGAAGSPLTDVDTTNNEAQNNFDNIPLMMGVAGGGVPQAQAQFFIYNHKDVPAEASLLALPYAPGWNARFEGIADARHIQLGPKQWLAVTAIVTPAADAPMPRRGAPILVDVSQQVDGATVGGLTLAVQPPDFGQPGTAAQQGGYWLGVRAGGGWPLSPMTDDFDPGFLFAVDLERVISRRLRLGLEVGYHSFAVEPPASGELSVTNVDLFARLVGSSGGWQPYASLGLGGYRVAGDWKAGVAVGGGTDLPISSRLALTTGLAARRVESTRHGDLAWIEAFLGLRAALP